jgi:DNA polymerase elongation subunit (family B)
MNKKTCRVCGGKLHKRGYFRGSKVQSRRFQCANCGAWENEPLRTNRPARILLLDIETLPGEYYLWHPKQEYAQPEMQIKDWSVLCWAAKWLFDDKIYGEVVTPQEAQNRVDGKILEGIWKLVNEADVVVTQNGKRFDMPSLNTRWLKYGYRPPSHYQHVDVYQIAKQKFRFTYNRLDELGKFFGIGGKIKMEFADWRKCLEGSLAERKKALKKQLEYCKNDVAPLLEEVYLYILPWINNHPNMNVFAINDQPACRNCGSYNLSWSEQYATPQGLWLGWRCGDCGAIGRGTTKEYNEWRTHIK